MKGWNPSGCIVEYAKRQRGPRKWIAFSGGYTLNEAVRKITKEFMRLLPEYVFRIRVP